ncbi:MAG: nitrilase-related carbon-nitrogen hydrolase [Planctomycetota bacterium]
MGTARESPAARVHLVQLDIAWEDKQANHERITQLVHAAAPAAGDLVVLPEMFDTGFSLRVAKTGRDPDVSIAFLRHLATSHGVTVVGGITVRQESGRGLNRAMVIGPDGETRCTYDKVHPFSFGREQERFDGGGEAGVTWAWEQAGVQACPVVCYDLRFPELFRAGLDRGAEAFVVIANWPEARREHWRALVISRAIENQAYVIAVNRCGTDPHLAYAGGSLAVDPQGQVLVEADGHAGIWAAGVEQAAVRGWRQAFPAWQDRRVGPDGRITPERPVTGLRGENQGGVAAER